MCNGLRSVLQLSDDDSTSITKLGGRKRKEEKIANSSRWLLSAQTGAIMKRGRRDRAGDGVVGRVVNWVISIGFCVGAANIKPRDLYQKPSRFMSHLGAGGCTLGAEQRRGHISSKFIAVRTLCKRATSSPILRNPPLLEIRKGPSFPK